MPYSENFMTHHNLSKIIQIKEIFREFESTDFTLNRNH